MNKRQKKKMQKKFLPVMADEWNLLTMTPEEQEKAYAELEQFKRRYAFRRRFKDLKKSIVLWYVFPIGRKYEKNMKRRQAVAASIESPENVQNVQYVTQDLDALKKNMEHHQNRSKHNAKKRLKPCQFISRTIH